MQNTQENFPEVPVEQLSAWSVVRKSDGVVLPVTSQTFDPSYTEVTFDVPDGVSTTARFTPGVNEQLQNDEYAVVFTHGGEPVTDYNGSN